MQNYCYILQLKYSPGLWKEIQVLGEGFESIGLKTLHMMSAGFRWMQEERGSADIIYVSSATGILTMVVDFLDYFFRKKAYWKNIFRQKRPSVIFFYGAHPLNFLISRLAREIYPVGLRCVMVHEPYKNDSSAIGSWKLVYFRILELFQTWSIRLATHVVVPSPYAKQLFYQRYAWYQGKLIVASLMIPDRNAVPIIERRFITMVGHLFPDGRLEAFLDLVHESRNQGKEYIFQVITSSPIGKELQEEAANFSSLNIISRDKLTDDEINQAVSESIAVLIMHRQGSQSGVLPVAYMNGTPVIARDLPGFSQNIIPGITGFLVKPDASPQEWLEAIYGVEQHLKEMSRHARRYYESNYSPETWVEHYKELLVDIPVVEMSES